MSQRLELLMQFLKFFPLGLERKMVGFDIRRSEAPGGDSVTFYQTHPSRPPLPATNQE